MARAPSRRAPGSSSSSPRSPPTARPVASSTTRDPCRGDRPYEAAPHPKRPAGHTARPAGLRAAGRAAGDTPASGRAGRTPWSDGGGGEALADVLRVLDLVHQGGGVVLVGDAAVPGRVGDQAVGVGPV